MLELDTAPFKDLTAKVLDEMWDFITKRSTPGQYRSEQLRVRRELDDFLRHNKLSRDKVADRRRAMKEYAQTEWGCILKQKGDELVADKCVIGAGGNVEIDYPDDMVGDVHYHPYQAQFGIPQPYASDEDIPSYTQNYLSDRDRFRFGCIVMDDYTTLYDMRGFTREAWDAASKKVLEKSGQAFSMMAAFGGGQMALISVFETLAQDGVIRRYRVKTGETIRIEERLRI